MKQLLFNITGQELTRTDSLELVSDAIGQFEAVFTFDEWWSGYTPTVQFTKGGKTIDCILKDNKCVIPPESLQGGGFFCVNVFSTDGMGDRKTASDVAVPLKKSGYKKDGSHSQDPTPTVYEQLMREYEEMEKQISEHDKLYYETLALKNDVEKKLISGEFTGEKGDKGDKGEKGEKGDKGDKGDSADINNALTTEYYAVEIVKMVQNGIAQSNVTLITNNNMDSGSYTYTLTAGILFCPVTFEDGIQHKVVDAPFDFIYVNGAIWNNKHQFTRVGITSPVITEQLGITDILWFDTTIPRLMGHFGMSEGDYKVIFNDASDYQPEGRIALVFTVGCSVQQAAYQAKGLWDLILSNPKTKLIFEYENQENIPVIDAPYSYDATPIDAGGFDNEN